MGSDQYADSALVAAAAAGDVGAFEALYRLYSGRVYGLCLRLARNAADAQDSTQETFIKAWRQLGGFRGGSSFGTWLHRIAVNEVLTRKRRAATEDRHLEIARSDVVSEPTGRDPDPELDQLERAIRRLPERAREAFVLHKIYGYTHEESASMLDITVGTCKSQVHRALQLLGERLHFGAPPYDDGLRDVLVSADE